MGSCSIEKTGKHVGLRSWNHVHSPKASSVQSTALKTQSTGRNLNNSANVFFKCVLPAPKETTIKNIRKLLQFTLA
jgi:hypothetical protein